MIGKLKGMFDKIRWKNKSENFSSDQQEKTSQDVNRLFEDSDISLFTW